MTSFRYGLALGSNLGDRFESLRRACGLLADVGDGLRLSRVYETVPQYVPDQPDFLNMAVTMTCSVEPLELLPMMQEIERRLGRVPTRRQGPRVLDIDLVLCDSIQLVTDVLRIPHPAFRERDFVLRPLAEIAADWIDPVTGKTVEDLAAMPGSTDGVIVYDQIIRL